jgi:putative spermidine/putrescine transport system permease protein
MTLSRPSKWALAAITAVVLAFVYVPLLVVLVNSFSSSRTFAWPPPGFTTEWWRAASTNPGVRDALATSVVTALIAAATALVLGTLASLALTRHSFFGRDVVSLLILLPIALPGIVTGLALNAMFTDVLGGLTFLTLVIGHATFCVVVIYNNVAARLRRIAGNLAEASADLGADPVTTFRLVTLPLMRNALLAGGLLAFGLSFDEIVVTTFTAGVGIQTLPLWIFQNLFRPQQAPIVNAVAAALVILSVVPVYLAQRLSGGAAELRR